MSNKTVDFFDRLAQCFDANQPKLAISFYYLPTVIMNDTKKQVFSREEELIKSISELMLALQSVGVVRHNPEVCQIMRLSDNILFSNVKWRFYGEDGSQIFSCVTSYTLQRNADESLKIIVAVIDDEERELAKLLNK